MSEIIAGVDVGFGQVKVCLNDGRSGMKTLCFPRIFAEAKTSNWGLNNHTVCGIEGDRFYVGGFYEKIWTNSRLFHTPAHEQEDRKLENSGVPTSRENRGVYDEEAFKILDEMFENENELKN